MHKAAVIQMASGPQVAANLAEAGRLLTRAAEGGAVLAVLPENFAQMAEPRAPFDVAEAPGDGLIQGFLAETARRLGLWIVGGTVPLRETRFDGETVGGERPRVRAASLVYDASGECVARYDKIHLFDVRLPRSSAGAEESYTESDVFAPGDAVQIVDTPIGRLGLTICYDLRFPELFRALLGLGAEGFVVPSAFTAQTGQAHWSALLRARAIENQAFVLAAAQGGFHVNGRETYGHSLVVDAWGRVVQELARAPGVVIVDIDLEAQRDLRGRFPAVLHRRLRCSGELSELP
ncbi:MAG: carbon-nitrogen hydrolase family protein [Thioalkalivibrionaceae bacterium]